MLTQQYRGKVQWKNKLAQYLKQLAKIKRKRKKERERKLMATKNVREIKQ